MSSPDMSGADVSGADVSGARMARAGVTRPARAEQVTPTSAVARTLPSAAGPLAALIAEPLPRAEPTGDQVPAAGTVLLLPGYTGSKEDFLPLLDPLARMGFRAVAVDLPGQFESPGPEAESAYAPLALGRVCAGVVRHLAQTSPVVLLGHSYGGLVARGAVLAGAPISGLVLLCSGPAAFRSGDRLDSLVAGEPILREHGKEVVYDNTVAVGRAARREVPPELAELLRRRFLSSSEAGLLGMGSALRTEPDRVTELHDALSRAGTPVAVIAGRDDDAWPLPDQQDMAERLGTELALIDGAAHSPAVENPEALLAVLVPLVHRWLAAA
jgi:pimeloyl-ACP methyl ester carboxylesterase